MFKIEISTDNDAFAEDKRGEIARILSALVVAINRGNEPSKVMDINGNACGKVTWGI
jgi:hypothetical protein